MIKEKVKAFLGYKNRIMPPIIEKKIEEEIKEYAKYLEIQSQYKISKDKTYAIAMYSVGDKIDKKIQEYMNQGEAMRGMILDKISIVALDQISENIKLEIQKNTNLYIIKEEHPHPNSKKMPIKMQKEILENMDKLQNITISETYQLNPVKTVAVKYHLGKILKIYNRCESCENPCEIKEKWFDYKALYHTDKITFHKNIKNDYPSIEEKMPEILKEISKDTLVKYKEKDISKEIYKETMTDIEIWTNDYKEKTGKIGIKEYEWVEKSLDLQVFKLGRLQFELDEVSSDFQKTIIYVHIQSGSKLDYQKCQKSYKQAKEFYEKHYKIDPGTIKFICESWILNPQLKWLLPKQSNILKFQKDYEIINKNLDDEQAEQRIFGEIKENKADYPEITTLQKNIKKALLEGKKFGSYKGMF